MDKKQNTKKEKKIERQIEKKRNKHITRGGISCFLILTLRFKNKYCFNNI